MIKEIEIDVPDMRDVGEWAFKFVLLGDEFIQNGFAFNEFIQLVYNIEEGSVKFTNETFLYDEKLFYYGFYKFPLEGKQTCEKDFLWNLMKKHLDSGNLIMGYWDEPVLFDKGFSERPYLVYGYDDAERQFCCLCQHSHEWKYLKIGLDTFIKTIHKGRGNIRDGYARMCFYIKNQNYRRKLSGKRIIDKMTKYLQSLPKEGTQHYGLNGIKTYFQDLYLLNEERTLSDVDSINIIINQKRWMLKRLEFVNRSGFLYKLDKQLSEYGSICTKMEETLQAVKGDQWDGELENIIRLLDEESAILNEALIHIKKKYKWNIH